MKRFKCANKVVSIFLVCLMTLCMIPVYSVSALSAGIYTGNVTSSYYNPDTGAVDDGGTSNAALGDGMCRSATGTTALMECDGKNTWVTIRLLLQSNCSNVSFYTRNGYDNYSKVSYEIMQEDSANDSIDYRFKVADAGVKIKATMYVAPMGRNVTWYIYINTSSLKSGSGDFVTSINLNNTSLSDSSVSSEASVGTVDRNNTSSTVSGINGSQTHGSGNNSAADKADVNGADNSNNKNAENYDSEYANDKKDLENEESVIKDDTENSDEDTDSLISASDTDSEQTNADEDIDLENEVSGFLGGAGILFAAVAVIIAAVCGVMFFVKRKKQ